MLVRLRDIVTLNLLATSVLALGIGLLASATLWAQAPAVQGNVAVEPRIFAPGVETSIPSESDPEETTSIHKMVEIRAQKDLEWQPKLQTESRTLYRQAERARFTRDIWCLDFSFKPLRMIRLETPGEANPQKLVWYMVYHVKNNGKAIHPIESEVDGKFNTETVASGPIRFMPHMVLQGQDVSPNGGKLYRAYLDQIIPGAIEPIRQREIPGRTLLSSVEMAAQTLAEGADAWGVAMWDDVDPEMDFFSIYIRGLSNAYQWTDPPGAFQMGDLPGKGREFARKTLQLNFWRPGDRFMQSESEVTYGVPAGKASLYGVDEGVDYRWIYR